jgi:hypothetical protein
VGAGLVPGTGTGGFVVNSFARTTVARRASFRLDLAGCVLDAAGFRFDAAAFALGALLVLVGFGGLFFFLAIMVPP